ncbi:MAG: TetR/AcrR family transcriptional regulator [Cytobacillus gottheilii]|uniref:TetR/AcrR family transcriptional regulator n=1 Tax=Cytobacillus gottheilii TaxID=859144 RepID=UPI003463C81B
MARERKFSLEELYRQVKPLLLSNGYEGFTFSHLADALNVARGTIYKYFENKDELITAYMIFEMEQSHKELQQISLISDFNGQFDFLISFMFQNSNLHRLIEIGKQVQSSTEVVKKNKQRLMEMQIDMYKHLQDFISLGKQENMLKSHLPDTLILGYIFQSIAIPNHFGIPQTVWVSSIKEMLKSGMFAHNN